MDARDIRHGDWMQVYGGQQFWPLDPRMDEFSLDAIAHALSQICRFGGHTKQFYSVAEHSYLLSTTFEDPKLALQALLHDAAEAYVGDMVRPLKRNMLDYQSAENYILALILTRHGLGSELTWEIHEADNRILLDERARLLHPSPASWGPVEDMEPLGVRIEPLEPQRAKSKWVHRYHELLRELD